MAVNGSGKYFPSTKALSLYAMIQLKLDIAFDMDKISTSFSAHLNFSMG